MSEEENSESKEDIYKIKDTDKALKIDGLFPGIDLPKFPKKEIAKKKGFTKRDKLTKINGHAVFEDEDTK